MSLDLVLFDCDGTLIDSQAMILKTFAGAFAACGLPSPDPDLARATIGLSLPEAMARLTDHRPDAPVDELVAGYRTSFLALGHDLTQTAPLFPGARTALAALASRSDTLLGIVTGKSRKGLDAILDVHGLDDRFVVIRTGDDGPSKPHPFMVLDAMDAVGARPERTVVVGDTSYDIEMGRAARARTLGVLWGYHSRDRLVDSGADEIAGSFADVPGRIEVLLADGGEL